MSVNRVPLLRWVRRLMLNMWKWPTGREWHCIDRDGGKAAGSQPLCSASLQHGREASVDTHVHAHARAHTHRCENTHMGTRTLTSKDTLLQINTQSQFLATHTHTHTPPEKERERHIHTQCSRWGASTSQRCHFSVSCSGRSALTFYEALCRNQQLVMAAGLSLLSTPSISFPHAAFKILSPFISII